MRVFVVLHRSSLCTIIVIPTYIIVYCTRADYSLRDVRVRTSMLASSSLFVFICTYSPKKQSISISRIRAERENTKRMST